MSDESNQNQDDYAIGGPLYHYTDAKGLLGIMESKKIWATHIRYLNDEREFQHGIRIAHSIVADKDFEGAAECTLENLTDLQAYTEFSQRYDSFVTSFSRLDDDLSQWRAYSRSGAGFNICFNPGLLERIITPSGFRLYQCCYNEEEQKNRLRAVYSDAASRLLDEPSEKQQVFANFVNELLMVAATLKHPTFIAEDEWRLVSAVSDDDLKDVKCRAGASMLIPYMEVDLTTGDGNESPISGVCVGPSAHKTLSVQAIGRHLDNNGIPNFRVTESAIPFRNW